MAQADAGGEQEYESDPEELKRSLATRRREASDDEDEDDEEVKNQRAAEIDSDSDQSDGLVDNDENKSGDGEDSYEEEEEEEDDDDDDDDDRKVNLMKKSGEDDDAAGHVDGEEDKEKQSSAVPTGGAFYMHDDRFQELSAGRSRRGRGGRRSWGSGDERKWGHDKYEEMNTQEKHHDRTSRGGFRGRGRGRGQGRGSSRGRSSNASSSNGHQIFVPKATTRGGEPRKDEIPLSKGNQAHSVQSKPLRNSRGSQHWHEKIPHHDSRRSPSAPAKTGNEDTKKNLVVSSLSSASPPFYPSVSSSSLVHGIQVGMERLQTNESAIPSGKKLRNTKSVYLPVHTAQTFQPTSQIRGAPTTGNVFYPQSHSQGGRFSSPMQLNGDSKGTSKSYTKPSGQDFDQHSAVIRPLSSSSQRTGFSGNRNPPGDLESASDTGASFGKGKGTLQASGSGSLMYSGSQVMGHAESLASADNSNFPAFLPVMQFGGQHGGVPTFGMAFPGYVQPENGIGNPEMTWMPVLTGPGPGALGASYSPPYAAIDGSYQTHKPESSSKENLDDLERPLERPEVTESGVSKRQNSNPSKQPRRYSEMSFRK
ncbi:hypothetical protein Bca4012_053893 [Brassica carinata]|uniref:Btz domain-containing protein n=1 Tax=Brassica carinata TaxID=52824 RepID=A0A8X8B0Y4_BRACI|nr:hypothetical protein Bca52824_013067 [Brassica carinata]